MVGARERAETGSWHESLPEGSLLLAPCALVAFLPLALGAAIAFLSRTLAIRSAGVLASAAAGAILLFLAGPHRAWDAYREHGLLWELARTRFAPASVLTALPVSLTGAALVAAIASLWDQAQRPFWVQRTGRGKRHSLLAQRRERRRLASGEARPDGGSGSASPRVAMSSRSPSQSWRSTP